MMNIFESSKGLFGKHKKGELKELSSNFWNLAKEIREKLGEDAYVLDSYLSEIFTNLDNVMISNVTEKAEEMMNKIYFLCKNLVDYRPIDKKDKMYELARDYIISHPLPYKESDTRFRVYVILLIDELTEIFIEESLKHDGFVAFLDYNHLSINNDFEKISEVVGEEEMEKLNEAIKKRFVVPNILEIFKRTVNRKLFYYFIEKDKQTSKQTFQLILDSDMSL